jgi:hypothetical protein
MRLSAQSIARLRLEPGQGEKRFFDDALPGFGLRLRAGGKRTWIAQYRAADGKSKTFTIGPVEKRPMRPGGALAKPSPLRLLEMIRQKPGAKHEPVRA